MPGLTSMALSASGIGVSRKFTGMDCVFLMSGNSSSTVNMIFTQSGVNFAGRLSLTASVSYASGASNNKYGYCARGYASSDTQTRYGYTYATWTATSFNASIVNTSGNACSNRTEIIYHLGWVSTNTRSAQNDRVVFGTTAVNNAGNSTAASCNGNSAGNYAKVHHVLGNTASGNVTSTETYTWSASSYAAGSAAPGVAGWTGAVGSMYSGHYAFGSSNTTNYCFINWTAMTWTTNYLIYNSTTSSTPILGSAGQYFVSTPGNATSSQMFNLNTYTTKAGPTLGSIATYGFTFDTGRLGCNF